MKNLWRALSVAIFLFGIVTFLEGHRGASGGQVPIDVSDTEPAQAFVVEYVDSKVSPAGIITQTGRTTRYVKADGEWRLELRQNGQAKTTVYSGTPDGVFEKDKTERDKALTRRYVSPSSDQDILQLYRSHNYLRNQPDFVRTDEVAGLQVYVIRKYMDAASPEEWLERSYSPKTGLTILRLVSHMRDGSESRREAVSVEFKDVPEDLNQDLKNLPIRQTEKKNQ